MCTNAASSLREDRHAGFEGLWAVVEGVRGGAAGSGECSSFLKEEVFRGGDEAAVFQSRLNPILWRDQFAIAWCAQTPLSDSLHDAGAVCARGKIGGCLERIDGIVRDDYHVAGVERGGRVIRPIQYAPRAGYGLMRLASPAVVHQSTGTAAEIC